jgi:hypothetical protein
VGAICGQKVDVAKVPYRLQFAAHSFKYTMGLYVCSAKVYRQTLQRSSSVPEERSPVGSIVMIMMTDTPQGGQRFARIALSRQVFLCG